MWPLPPPVLDCWKSRHSYFHCDRRNHPSRCRSPLSRSRRKREPCGRCSKLSMISYPCARYRSRLQPTKHCLLYPSRVRPSASTSRNEVKCDEPRSRNDNRQQAQPTVREIKGAPPDCGSAATTTPEGSWIIIELAIFRCMGRSQGSSRSKHPTMSRFYYGP